MPPSTDPASAEPESFGPPYTRGRSFRARAEARQRWYRAEILKVGWERHGHWLDPVAARAGANFLRPDIAEAARRRQAEGKGVADRTFQNLLSSQAMAFNLFAPLAADPDLATAVLGRLLPVLGAVRSITIEHTPATDLFGDQSGRGGVDCDVLVEADLEGEEAVLVIETKLVEPEFSTCGFRRPGRASRGAAVCPEDVPVAVDRAACAYAGRKGYRYWEQTDAVETLRALPLAGCPFGGPLWQLWVNHTLAAAEARRRGATRSRLLVCAPTGNEALLQGGRVLTDFRALLLDPTTVEFLDVDHLITAIGLVVGGDSAWFSGLLARYAQLQDDTEGGSRGPGSEEPGGPPVGAWSAPGR